jgi:hypothetical protein
MDNWLKRTMKNPLYMVWCNMIRRCYRPRGHEEKYYYGRGIAVCDEWHDSAVFMRWALLNGYKKGLDIDRIENSKGYSPDNCRFIPHIKNMANMRRNVYLTIDGDRQCLAEWARRMNADRGIVSWWIKNKGEEHAIKKIKERMMFVGQL